MPINRKRIIPLSLKDYMEVTGIDLSKYDLIGVNTDNKYVERLNNSVPFEAEVVVNITNNIESLLGIALVPIKEKMVAESLGGVIDMEIKDDSNLKGIVTYWVERIRKFKPKRVQNLKEIYKETGKELTKELAWGLGTSCEISDYFFDCVCAEIDSISKLDGKEAEEFIESMARLYSQSKFGSTGKKYSETTLDYFSYGFDVLFNMDKELRQAHLTSLHELFRNDNSYNFPDSKKAIFDFGELLPYFNSMIEKIGDSTKEVKFHLIEKMYGKLRELGAKRYPDDPYAPLYEKTGKEEFRKHFTIGIKLDEELKLKLQGQISNKQLMGIGTIEIEQLGELLPHYRIEDKGQIGVFEKPEEKKK